jgi:hypothetical protein
MLSLLELDRICTISVAGAFGVRLFNPQNFNEIDLRQLRAGVANSSRRAIQAKPVRAGAEQGNQ